MENLTCLNRFKDFMLGRKTYLRISAISLVPLFQSESKCETILMKMTDLHENETAFRTHFHMKGFALKLVLKQRHKRTRKLPTVLRLLSRTEFAYRYD